MSDQQHPQESRDRAVLNTLLNGEASPENMAELARLRIRYLNFPGAREIQRDLELVLHNWQIDEAELFSQTRKLHQGKKVYARVQDDTEDWS